ncbi:MAG: glycosyl hydrolase family 65 protein, partial [Gammaproteobacteria bacterium]
VQDGSTREGIHLGAMAASVDLAQRCFTGCEIRGGALRFNPRLPLELGSLDLWLRYRGHWLNARVDQDILTVEAGRSSRKAFSYYVREELHEIHPGERQRHRI